MSFQDIPPIENYQSYLDIAFNKAAKKAALARAKKTKEENLEKSKRIESVRIDVINTSLNDRLRQIISSFPSIDSLPEFYLELLKCTLEYELLKKSLGAVNWAVKKANFFSREYSSKIRKTKDLKKINFYRKQYYGRVSSLLKQIRNELSYLEKSRKIMKAYPAVKTGIKTICIAGFPNVGKTTLLYKLTGSKPEINSYPFTTKGINISYLKKDKEKIQLLDTPGTLNRFEKMNNIEKQASLAIKLLAETIIYVFDITEPYPLEQQIKLYNALKKSNKNILIYLSKTDILEKEKIKDFSKKFRITTIDDLKEILF